MKKHFLTALTLCLEAPFILLMLTACEPVNRYFGWEDDNVVENAIEDAIELKTNAQIDLTPSTPDDGFHLFPRNKL